MASREAIDRIDAPNERRSVGARQHVNRSAGGLQIAVSKQGPDAEPAVRLFVAICVGLSS